MIICNPSKSNQCSASAASRLKLHHGTIDSSYDPAAPPQPLATTANEDDLQYHGTDRPAAVPSQLLAGGRPAIKRGQKFARAKICPHNEDARYLNEDALLFIRSRHLYQARRRIKGGGRLLHILLYLRQETSLPA